MRRLEREKVALLQENGNQRRRFEHCLGDVTNHVIRVLLAQKVSKRTACMSLLVFAVYIHAWAGVGLCPVHTADTDGTKLFCHVGVGGVNTPVGSRDPVYNFLC